MAPRAKAAPKTPGDTQRQADAMYIMESIMDLASPVVVSLVVFLFVRLNLVIYFLNNDLYTLFLTPVLRSYRITMASLYVSIKLSSGV